MNNKDLSIPETVERTSPYENDYVHALTEMDIIGTPYDCVGLANALANWAYEVKDLSSRLEDDDDKEVYNLCQKAELLAVELAQVWQTLDNMEI